ncbi:MAG: molybdopterin-dependent oxidoreductase [Acidobacteria bacterium]|jgi:4-hydroxybenzoyl-CoA reductase subunit alpha|nr:molybdopterin-dependent oxidoreductase [Acidobacteriota bacterium]MEB2350032.1 xanthine dehydrogenase family protein molybdopterin-binding subunit [Burkholderiaceae bacterium]
MDQLRYVGKSYARRDGPDKVTGRAMYTQDVKLPGTLVGRVLRSPHAHARIVRIDTSRARALPGVKGVITIDDSKGIKHGFVETPRYPPDQEVLARERVRHVGEEIAAVAATDEVIAQRAIDLIEIEYEVLPAVFDPFEAMAPGAPEIHPSHPKVRSEVPYSNIGGRTATGWGDVSKGFEEADYVREDRFESHLRTHGYLEPQVTLAHWESGKLNVWTSSMGAFVKRAKLARVLDLPYSAVRVHKAYVGGTFGGKIDLYSHEYCAARLSMLTGLPVRIVATREEIFSAYRHGQPLVMEVKTGVRKDGTIVAQQVRTINNSGAYRGSGVVVIFLGWGFTMLPYRIPNLAYEGLSVYTNNPVRAPQRGHGCPQIRFAIEAQLDHIAEDLGIDPVTIRLRNARRPWEELPNGDNVHEAGLIECIKVAAEKSGFSAKYGRGRNEKQTLRRGIGMGVSSYFGGSLIYPNGSGVIVKMADDGSVTVLTGAIDVGQGSETVISQIVAEELSLPMEDVKIISSDTDTTPQDIGAWISGMTYVTGNAARQAAGNARNKMLELVAERFECPVEHLRVSDKAVYHYLDRDRRMSYQEIIALSVATRRGDTIIGEGFWRTMRDEPAHPSLASTKGRWSENYAFSCQVAEVEVDTETGEVRLTRAVTVHDCGFPMNPALVSGQVDGQVSMALGHAFLEEVMMKDGYTLNPTWLDYRMPTIHEIAESEDAEVITEQYTVGKAFRVKEVGEGLVSGILAAIANAVYDATGVRMYSTPFSPEKILRGLRHLQRESREKAATKQAGEGVTI